MKFALIINGDTESRHRGNVMRSLLYLQSKGYHCFVANTVQPGLPVDAFKPATQKGLTELTAELKGKITDQDELLIYTTGHGDLKGTDACLVMEDGCHGKDLAAILKGIPYARRTIIMDQCYSGNWNKVFTSDPRTLFLSTGSRFQTVCCQETAPKLWAPDAEVPDLNGDGDIHWQERFAHATPESSTPQFVPTPDYVPDGKPSFPKEAQFVDNHAALKTAIKNLKPGQYAIMMFSADWCGICKHYRPNFEAMAKQNQGQHLWLWTNNEAWAKEQKVDGFPTLWVMNHRGEHLDVPDLKSPLSVLAQAEEFDPYTRLKKRVYGYDPRYVWWQVDRIQTLAFAITHSGLNHPQVQGLFSKLITQVKRSDVTPSQRKEDLTNIAIQMAAAGLPEGLRFFKTAFHQTGSNISPLIGCLLELQEEGGDAALAPLIAWAKTVPQNRIAYMSALALATHNATELWEGIFQEVTAIRDPEKRAKQFLQIADWAGEMNSQKIEVRAVLQAYEYYGGSPGEFPATIATTYVARTIESDDKDGLKIYHTDPTLLARMQVSLRRVRDPDSRAEAQTRLVEPFYDLDQRDLARMAFSEAAASARQIPDPKKRAEAQTRLVIWVEKNIRIALEGEDHRVTAVLSEALASARLIRDPDDRSSLQLTIADYLLEVGNLPLAAAATQEAYASSKKIDDSKKRIERQVTILPRFYIAGLPEQAEAVLNDLRPGLRAIPTEYTLVSGAIGILLEAQRYPEAVTLAFLPSDPFSRILMLSHCAEAMIKTQHLAEAVAVLDKIPPIIAETGTVLNRVHYWRVLANLYVDAKRPDKAIPLLKEARKIVGQLVDAGERRQKNEEIADVYIKLGMKAEALVILEEMRNYTEQHTPDQLYRLELLQKIDAKIKALQ